MNLKQEQLGIITENQNTNQRVNQSMNLNSLSPFTWTHIKLPPLPHNKIKAANVTLREKQPKINNQKDLHGLILVKKNNDNKQMKSPKKNKMKFVSLNKTIDIDSKVQERVKNRVYRQNSIDYRYKKQSNTNEEENNKKQIIRKGIILKHLEKKSQKITEQSNKEKNDIKSQLSRSKSPTDQHKSRSPIFSPRYRFPMHSFSEKTFSYNKIQGYIRRGLIQAGWKESKGSQTPQLIWSDQFYQKDSLHGQLHNHIKNSHYLTMKNTLHQLQSLVGSSYYPASFSIPFEYYDFSAEYEQSIVKIALKHIITQAKKSEQIPKNCKINKCLGTILPKMTNKNYQQFNQKEHTLMGIKLCLYLERYRKKKNYRYFQTSENYRRVLTDLQPSVVQSLVTLCYHYNDQMNRENQTAKKYFDISAIDSEVLELLWHYYCMLQKFQNIQKNLSFHNVWIVKPIASSRGAGIFLLPNSLQYTQVQSSKFEYYHQKKFQNKIIQRYIANPYLLKNHTQFSAPYMGKKFDIRNWVLVTCQKNRQPLIYIYSQGYCRFSKLKYQLYDYKSKDQQKIHLTNYSMFKKSNSQINKAKSTHNQDDSSVMMLSQFLELEKKCINLQSFHQQLETIVIESIMNNSQLVFEKGKFQLFGFDILMDEQCKLWLLQINLNPACQSLRYNLLDDQSKKMVKNMMDIVTCRKYDNNILEDKWKKIYGTEALQFNEKKQQRTMVETFKQYEQENTFLNNSEFTEQIKPFYKVSLDPKDSLVQEVKKRNIMMKIMMKTVTIINLRQIWSDIKNYRKNQEIIQQSQNNSEQVPIQ